MFHRASRNRRALSLLIVVLMAVSGLFVVALEALPAAQAASCSQTGSVISGNWYITTTQVCSGIMYTVDGSVYIYNGGSLTLQNGGLSFLQDTNHRGRFLTVYGTGSSLTLVNSIVTSQTNAIDPYLYLNISVNGLSSFTMTQGSVLQFPGWFNTSSVGGSPTITLSNSEVTGIPDSALTPLFSSNALVDLNDDAPVIAWSGTNAYLYRSNLSKLFEDPVAAVRNAQPMSLQGSSHLYAYDTYIGIDYANATTSSGPYIHNTLSLTGSSSAYLYNLTIDLSQSPSSFSQYSSAFSFGDGTSTAYLLRWLHVTVTDAAGNPVGNAGIWSRLSPTPTTATYPETGSPTPSSTTLAYLGGKTSGNWNLTGSNGQVLIPQWTDTLNQASAPNAYSFGSFTETAKYLSYSSTGGASFPPYPSLSTDANNEYLTLPLNTAPICPSPVVTWNNLQFSGAVSLSSSVLVTGPVTLTNANVFVEQSATACSYIMVSSTGSLTVTNSVIGSNYPIVLAVAGGQLKVQSGSNLALSANGHPGMLRSNASAQVTVTDSTVNANVALMGAGTTLARDMFLGPDFSVHTTALLKLYDANLNAVQSISLLTDLGSNQSLAIDVRNVTFNQLLTPQLQFSGTQDVQLTNVSLYDPTGTWYLGMIGGSAIVSRYWWVDLNDVDGTGTLLASANATILVQRINPKTLQPVAAPNPVPGDTAYFTANTTWPVSAPLGTVLYRAYQDSWTANGGHTVNDTYVVSGTASVQGTTFYPDSSITTTVTADTVANLRFSTLTPDFSVLSVVVTGDNGLSYLQPLNRAQTITATIHNAGQISVRNVTVDFFSTNVDLNNDGIMDSSVGAYQVAGTLIATVTVPLVPANGNTNASATWTFQGSSATALVISVVVNPPVGAPTGPGAIPETNTHNNIATETVDFFAWPDLAITGPSDVSFPAEAVANNTVYVNVTVHNLGTAAANGATLLIREGSAQVSNAVVFNILAGQAVTLAVAWRPTSPGYHNITVYVLAPNGTQPQTFDYNFANNWYRVQRLVLSQPDLALKSSDYQPLTEPQNTPFAITVHVYNLGQTPVQNTSVAVYLNGNYSTEYGRTTGIAVIHEANVTVQVSGLPTPGVNQTLNIVVNPNHVLVEGGKGFANNYANVTITITPPVGQIILTSPASATTYEPTETISVAGVVRDNTQAGNGIPNLPLTVSVLDSSGNVVLGPFNTQTDANGVFFLGVPLGGNLADGTYTLRVASGTGTGVSSATPSIVIHRNVSFLFTPVPLLGIQWWLFLVILAAVAAIVIGVTLYFKVYGLGKMVECGECGAFIPEDATVCPKCGVEFEKDMAKCSNCQAWIPVDVKQCPECGVEFATGEVEMADYQEKMRLQYDEVVQKFKEDASRQLGRTLSDKEFQEWWRKQPTFLTFEDWLREEEEMRKMGSRPCPVCGTLNSVTATVCHKCGSLMKEEKRPPSGGAAPSGGTAPAAKPAGAPARAPGPGTAATEPQGAPPTAPGAPETVRRVIRKPIAPAPVVQKKVIKRPVAEGEQASTQDGTDQQQSQSGDQKQEDEV